MAFLLGFLPMWLKAREGARGLAAAEQQLSLARMENSLSSAFIDARRGDYEPSRQSASQFFTSLREQADKGDASSLTRAQREGAGPLFTRRDEIITLYWYRGSPNTLACAHNSGMLHKSFVSTDICSKSRAGVAHRLKAQISGVCTPAQHGIISQRSHRPGDLLCLLAHEESVTPDRPH